MGADLAKKGSWPVSGGWLEQVDSFVQGVKVVWAEDHRIQAEKASGN